jgi:hypothetical protein
MSTNELEQQEPFKLSEKFAHVKGIKKRMIQKKNTSRQTPTWVDKLHKKKKTRANNNADNIFADFGSFTSFTQLLMVKQVLYMIKQD